MYSSSLMPSPVVSTIIPAYNAARFIAQAVESALQQGVPQQIIVVNDGSVDDTSDIVRSYGDSVELIEQANGGVSSARNRGIAAARGEFVAFLDADDVWLPGKLSQQLALFAADPALGTVICDEVHVTDDGEIVRPSFLASRRCHGDLPIQAARLAKPVSWLVRESFFPTSGVLTRRTVLARAGSFDTRLSICEDRDLWLRLAFEAPVGLVPDVMLRYMTGRADSLSVVATQFRWAEALYRILRRYRKRIDVAVGSEGTSVDGLLGDVFNELGLVFWYADRMDLAAGAFGDAIRSGAVRNLVKWLAARTGTASLLRRIKQVYATH